MCRLWFGLVSQTAKAQQGWVTEGQALLISPVFTPVSGSPAHTVLQVLSLSLYLRLCAHVSILSDLILAFVSISNLLGCIRYFSAAF